MDVYPEIAKVLQNVRGIDSSEQLDAFREHYAKLGSDTMPPSVEVLLRAAAEAMARFVPHAKELRRVAARVDAKGRTSLRATDESFLFEAANNVWRTSQLLDALTREVLFQDSLLRSRRRGSSPLKGLALIRAKRAGRKKG